MSLGFGILGFLNYGPMSGYDLVKAFESSLQFFWHAQSSHIYLELKKREKKGYICGETVIQSDRPNKRLFSITETGKKAFMYWPFTVDFSYCFIQTCIEWAKRCIQQLETIDVQNAKEE